MSLAIRALVLVMIAIAPALADGTTRVLLADADPELQRAVKATLAPWRLEVVIDTERPMDTLHAQTIAGARFVVWREGKELVVLDRERGEAEHRDAPAGPLDPASAAAAALTVKTLMRLPPPPPETAEQTPAIGPEPGGGIVAPATEVSGVELRVQGGAATRVTRGNANEFGGRVNLAVFVKPTYLPLRLGIAGDLGTQTDVQGAGFKGSWSDWSVVGLASWSFAIARAWELEPYAGAGVLRSMLDGTEGMMSRSERATLATLRAGMFVRRQVGLFSIGGVVGFEATPGTPTYTKMGMGSEVFEVPAFALAVGLVVAADLGR